MRVVYELCPPMWVLGNSRIPGSQAPKCLVAESHGGDFKRAEGWQACFQTGLAATAAPSLPSVKPGARDSSLGLHLLLCEMRMSESALTQTKVAMTLGERT